MYQNSDEPSADSEVSALRWAQDSHGTEISAADRDQLFERCGSIVDGQTAS